eukprot:7810031-Pyramimonas_sp.AAC.1
MPVHVRVKWKGFPTKPHTGCLREPLLLPWAWCIGDTGDLDLEVVWDQWVQNVERELCHIFDITGEDMEVYVGRTNGFRRKQVSLDTVLK